MLSLCLDDNVLKNISDKFSKWRLLEVHSKKHSKAAWNAFSSICSDQYRAVWRIKKKKQKTFIKSALFCLMEFQTAIADVKLKT